MFFFYYFVHSEFLDGFFSALISRNRSSLRADVTDKILPLKLSTEQASDITTGTMSTYHDFVL